MVLSMIFIVSSLILFLFFAQFDLYNYSFQTLYNKIYIMKIICDWDNCKEPGNYKAPVERDNVRKYKMLCLKHIKIFNKNWNYFENEQ